MVLQKLRTFLGAAPVVDAEALEAESEGWNGSPEDPEWQELLAWAREGALPDELAAPVVAQTAEVPLVLVRSDDAGETLVPSDDAGEWQAMMDRAKARASEVEAEAGEWQQLIARVKDAEAEAKAAEANEWAQLITRVKNAAPAPRRPTPSTPPSTPRAPSPPTTLSTPRAPLPSIALSTARSPSPSISSLAARLERLAAAVPSVRPAVRGRG